MSEHTPSTEPGARKSSEPRSQRGGKCRESEFLSQHLQRLGCAGRSVQSSPDAPGGPESGPVTGQRSQLWASRTSGHLVPKSPTAPRTLPEASARCQPDPGSGAARTKFHTHLSVSSSFQQESRGRKGRGVSLPRSAPTVSTLAIGSNPERVRTARRNSDIAVARWGSLRWGQLGGTLGPAAAAAAAARSPE